MKQTFRRKVQRGQQLGRTLGFPTVNFKVGGFGSHYKPGVYKCRVFYLDQTYTGLLHYGLKFPDKTLTLEMHILNFSQNIYSEFLTFKVSSKIRNPMTFSSPGTLKEQIKKDIHSVL